MYKSIMIVALLLMQLMANEVQEKQQCKDFIYAASSADIMLMKSLVVKENYNVFEEQVIKLANMLVGKFGMDENKVSKQLKYQMFAGMLNIDQIEIEPYTKMKTSKNETMYLMSVYNNSEMPFPYPFICGFDGKSDKIAVIGMHPDEKNLLLSKKEKEKTVLTFDLSTPKKTVDVFFNFKYQNVDSLHSIFTVNGFEKYSNNKLNNYKSLMSFMPKQTLDKLNVLDLISTELKSQGGMKNIKYYKDKLFGNNAKFNVEVTYNAGNITAYNIRLKKVNQKWLIADVSEN
ncbi:MAG: hypothetical protein U9N59_15940 [Campylobacterota bacterium]|nr:hypothetical protein [Campylobacterota bacterium]